jgi:hypothetical protein
VTAAGEVERAERGVGEWLPCPRWRPRYAVLTVQIKTRLDLSVTETEKRVLVGILDEV